MRLCSFSAFLLLFSALACFGQTTLSVNGVVSDAFGKPVAGISVTVIQVGCDCMCESPVGQIKGSATTDANGDFRIDAVSLAVQGGDLIVIAHEVGKLSGWSAISTDEGVPLKQSQLTDLKVSVFPITSVSGLVVDTAGRPIEGAQIGLGELTIGKAGARDDTIAASAIGPVAGFQPASSDSAGRFTLEGVPEHVKVEPSAKKPGFVQEPVTEGQDAMRVVLLRAGSITGKVVDGAGAPVVGAGVFAWSRGRYSSDSKVKTGSDGSFTTDDLAPSSYSVRVSPKDAEDTSFEAPVKVNVIAGKVTEAKPIILPKFVQFSGKILDATTSEGRPKLEIAIEGNKVSSSGKSDEQGEFKLWATPGEVHVSLSMPGADQYPYMRPLPPNDTIKVPDSGITGIALTAPAVQTATGKVVGPAGKPLAGIVVRTEDYGITRTTTGSDGKFTIAVPPKSDDSYYEMRGKKLSMVAYDSNAGLGGRASIDRDELLKNGVVLKLAPTKSMSVKVVDTSGSPLEGVEVDPMVSIGYSSYGSDDHIVTGPDGQAEIKSLIDGAKYHFSCTKTGFNMRQEEEKDYGFKVGGKDWTGSMVLTMDKADVVKVRVVDERGRPVPGAQGGNPSDYGKYPVIADEKGEFTIEVPSHADTEFGSERGMLITAADLEHDTCGILQASRQSLLTGKLTIILKPKSKLTVHVVDSAGRPLSGVQVSLSTSGMGPYFSEDSGNQQTDKDGNVTLDGLCQGCKFYASASLNGYANQGSPELPAVGASGWTGQTTLTLASCNRILQGKVVDNRDRPLAGAKVMCQNETQTSTVTDAGGMFTLKGLPDSDVYLQALLGDLGGSTEVSKDTDFITIVVSKQGNRFRQSEEEGE